MNPVFDEFDENCGHDVEDDFFDHLVSPFHSNR